MPQNTRYHLAVGVGLLEEPLQVALLLQDAVLKYFVCFGYVFLRHVVEVFLVLFQH